MGRCSLSSPKHPTRCCTQMIACLVPEVNWPAAQPLTRSCHQVEIPPEICPDEDGDGYFLILFQEWFTCLPLFALYCLPGHTVTVILSPLVRCIAVAVGSDHLEELTETAAWGTVQPAVHLQTPPRTADAALRSYMLSVTPEHPSTKAAAGPGPSTRFFLPPCSHNSYT